MSEIARAIQAATPPTSAVTSTAPAAHAWAKYLSLVGTAEVAAAANEAAATGKLIASAAST